MVLDNYLNIINKSGKELGSLSAPTLSVGSNIPCAWLCCFEKEDAYISEKDDLLAKVKISDAILRLQKKIDNNKLLLNFLYSKFYNNMLKEFIITKQKLLELSHSNDDIYVELYFGTYGDTITIEQFKKCVAFGKIIPYASTISSEIENEININKLMSKI